jgi:hypothetical protein
VSDECIILAEENRPRAAPAATPISHAFGGAGATKPAPAHGDGIILEFKLYPA